MEIERRSQVTQPSNDKAQNPGLRNFNPLSVSLHGNSLKQEDWGASNQSVDKMAHGGYGGQCWSSV